MSVTVGEHGASTRVSRSVAGGSRWELAMRTPARDLAPAVRELQGYIERTDGPVRRREFPGPQVVVILELGPALRVYHAGQERAFTKHAGGFVAGTGDAFTLTEHAGLQSGIQLNLQPLAARQLFGLPLSELRSRTVSLRDVLPRAWHGLDEQLSELPAWTARFELLERCLRSQLMAADEPHAAVAWTLQRMAAAGGALDLGSLARELGYSHKHLIALFHDQVGVPPKLWLRLLRFERLCHALRRGAARGGAELALSCGYYDQAHLARDVRQFTGGTPSQLRALLGGEPEKP
jgi:AraC-like DNA-binding protein